MNVTFSPFTPANATIRSALLRGSLRSYFQKWAPSAFPVVTDRADARSAAADLEALALLPRARHAEGALFVGMINDPAALVGRNILVLTRSLRDELAEFGERTKSGPRSPLWFKNVLRAYDSAILLDRTSVAGSVGYAPWIKLLLADRFPVFIDDVGALRAPPRALVIDHSGHDPKLTAALRDVAARCGKVAVLTGKDRMNDGVPDKLTADIHIHVGYSNHLAPVALTPFDSLANGAYTLIVPRETAGGHSAGNALVREADARTYVEVAPTHPAALRTLETMVGRVLAMHAQSLSFNPEIRRFERLNERYLAGCIKRFEDQVTA